MTTEQWLSLFKEAFEHANKPYTFERDFLLKDYPESPSEAENEHIFQIIDTFLRYFFVKALHGETFCAVENI